MSLNRKKREIKQFIGKSATIYDSTTCLPLREGIVIDARSHFSMHQPVYTFTFRYDDENKETLSFGGYGTRGAAEYFDVSIDYKMITFWNEI